MKYCLYKTKLITPLFVERASCFGFFSKSQLIYKVHNGRISFKIKKSINVKIRGQFILIIAFNWPEIKLVEGGSSARQKHSFQEKSSFLG